jgi:hypothetical protein
MKSRNVIEINTATMLDALQAWADKNFTAKVKVMRVREKGNGNVGADPIYAVDLDAAEEEAHRG